MNKDGESRPRALTRRRFLGVGGATLAGTVLLGSSVAGQSVKPNFLFITTDDMSKWML
jgi:hypothetical protein